MKCIRVTLHVSGNGRHRRRWPCSSTTRHRWPQSSGTQPTPPCSRRPAPTTRSPCGTWRWRRTTKRPTSRPATPTPSSPTYHPSCSSSTRSPLLGNIRSRCLFFFTYPILPCLEGGGNLNKSLLKTMNEFEFYMESQSAALGLRCRRLLDLFIAHFNYFSLCSPFTRFLSWNCGLSLVWSWGYF